MTHILPITGEYPPDWPQIADRVRAEADHRCIRCHHRYKTGEHGKGEWSPCDDKCTHRGPFGHMMADGLVIPIQTDNKAAKAIAWLESTSARRRVHLVAQWRILTVHHLDGNKANCAWWNLLSLCQRCHLKIQATVNPQQPFMLEHDEWMKPYVAGFYAKKYEGVELTREQVSARLDELLAHERIV